jgi:hypothetical protein
LLLKLGIGTTNRSLRGPNTLEDSIEKLDRGDTELSAVVEKVCPHVAGIEVKFKRWQVLSDVLETTFIPGL